MTVAANCGHQVDDWDQLISITVKEYVCDAVDGFSRAVAHMDVCVRCATGWRRSEFWLSSREEADAWLKGQLDDPFG